ncbi:MAG: DEAD/DEAH box helicase [Candidatus Fermentithermobacillus carboniphilus]|uniref:DEAD/DEAH box helicase n=1 Tax=Candidatus Fermentithermobacillus carboniphilus TaxID=3085328 RepID=A0AAT9LDM3_9FIRM|nr:MAG: DEAD/DEAH box helicase [Candidatus Fermentithermobacillus carboniphilus]
MPKMAKKKVADILQELRDDPKFLSGVTAWHHIPPSSGQYVDIPPDIHASLRAALTKKGIKKLYSHQKEAYDLVSQGLNVCVVTPTASGKTLCYNLPVLDSILKDEKTRALYVFPTKALAQDQLAELVELSRLGEFSVSSFTFDGDTPSHKRRLAKEVGQVIITNPDMLHQAILPHHPTWVRLFSSLKFVVIDEMHGYRGVFGSHVANVIRRLKRVAQFYGSRPQFILASATIANPEELASTLIEEQVTVVNNNGAPSSGKEFIFYNPPVVQPDGEIRQSAIDAASRIASRFIKNDVQTIVFARSRVSVEILVQYLRDSYNDTLEKERIQGYRGGYLPNERRAIEKALREGEIVGVAATNALELGIDIGQLDCVVMAGYPGTIASTWQQAGRAGRRTGNSVAILVAGGSPLDQFIVKNPDYFFSQSPEYALINPNNPYILGEHTKCAAYELPFKDDPEDPPKLGSVDVSRILEHLAEQKILYRAHSRWNWSSESFPAQGVSLRSASSENFVVVDTTRGAEVIGEVDWASAPLLIHDEAIYMHKGEQYHVLKLDYPARKAYVKKVNVDYYTDASLAVGIRVISVDQVSTESPFNPKFGEVSVTALATIFKKIKLYTHENVGSGEISLPEMNMHTQGMWFTLPDQVVKGMDPHSVGGVLSGLANVILNIAPLFLMCDKKDLGVSVEVRSTYEQKPTIYLYDSYPGGVGLSEKGFHLLPQILKASKELISACQCRSGCPGCVGPEAEVGKGTKDLCLSILRQCGVE